MSLILSGILLLGLLWAENRSRRMMLDLGQPSATGGRLRYDVLSLLALGLLLLPSVTEQQPGTEGQGAPPLVIAIDVSASMATGSAGATPLDRVREELLALLDQRPPGMLALIPFAGRPVVQVPLTSDRETVTFFLRHLQPRQVPDPGSAPREAARLAQQVLEAAGEKPGSVLLVSDGERTLPTPPPELAPEIRVDVLPIPERDPRPLHDANGQRRLDDQGRPLLTRSDPANLAGIAGTTGGRLLSWEQTRPLAPLLQHWQSEPRKPQLPDAMLLWLVLLLLLLRSLPRYPRPLSASVLLILLLAGCQPDPATVQQADFDQAMQNPDHQRAAALFATLARRSSGTTQIAALYNAGSRFLAADQPAAAVPLLRRALLKEPGSADLRTNYALALRQLRRGPGTGGETQKPEDPSAEGHSPTPLGSTGELLRAPTIRPYLPPTKDGTRIQELQVERDW